MNAPTIRCARYDGSAQDWDAFVRRHPEGRFCHLSAFHDAVQQSYGFEPVRYALWENGTLRGMLPISAGRSLLFGRKWVSMPFGEYGGFLLSPEASAAGAAALEAEVLAGARAAGVGAVELNGLLGLPDGAPTAFSAAVQYESAVLDLSPGPDNLLSKVFKYEVRKALKKGASAGVTCHEASDPDTLRRRFYPMFLQSMRRLGVPPHGLSFWLQMKEAFGRDLQIHWAEREGSVLAGLLGIRCGPRVQITTTVSTPEGWDYRPNDLVHWAYIQAACAEGAQLFDFGSVRYEGQRHYKVKWGATFRPAAHWLAGLKGNAKAATFDSSSSAMTRASKLWQKLVPESVGAWLGPVIRRQLFR